jgi:hypothetical protein
LNTIRTLGLRKVQGGSSLPEQLMELYEVLCYIQCANYFSCVLIGCLNCLSVAAVTQENMVCVQLAIMSEYLSYEYWSLVSLGKHVKLS